MNIVEIAQYECTILHICSEQLLFCMSIGKKRYIYVYDKYI
jgi:hypothetical protein